MLIYVGTNTKCQQSNTSQIDKDRVVAKQTVMEKQVIHFLCQNRLKLYSAFYI